MNYQGKNLLCLEVNNSRIWEFIHSRMDGSSLQTLKEDVLGTIIKDRSTIFIRVPFPYSPHNSQTEMLVDNILGRGYRLVNVTVFTHGLYKEQYILSRL
jgi:hypothetical protein